MESGLQLGCQETELPLEVPAGDLSQLQVHVLQPSVSQAEAQELKQVRPLFIHTQHALKWLLLTNISVITLLFYMFGRDFHTLSFMQVYTLI